MTRRYELNLSVGFEVEDDLGDRDGADLDAAGASAAVLVAIEETLARMGLTDPEVMPVDLLEIRGWDDDPREVLDF